MVITPRDKELLERLYHPQTVGDIERNQRSAYRRIKRLKEEGKVFVIGYVHSNGRPTAVVSSHRFKTDNVEHELMLSRVVLRWGYPCLRGKDVDQTLRPDGTIYGLHLEMDTGSMSLPRVEGRLRSYIDSEDTVLVITSTEKRKQAILARCSFLSAALLAVTYEDALQTPCKVMAEDCDGEKWALNKVIENLRNKARMTEQPSKAQVVV